MSEGSRRSRGAALGLAAALVLGGLLRLGKLPGMSLNYDGLQSVTHAIRGVPLGVFSAFLHDPHPPAYYVLLGGWMTLGTGDAAVLMLSLLLSLALVPSAWHVGRVHFGARAGLVAAWVCALHPLALYWSHFARMYALLMLLALWAWHFNRRLLCDGRWRWGAAAGAALTQLGLAYSHGAGLFFTACLALAAAAEGPPTRPALRRWLKLQLPLGLASLPAAAFTARKPPAHLRVPDWGELQRTLSLYVSGVDVSSGLWVAAGAAGFLLLVAALLVHRPSRAFAGCLLVLPFALGALVSHLGHPVWHGSRLFAFVTPFVALGVGRLTAGGPTGPRPLAAVAAALLLALILRGGLAYTFGFEKPQRFIDAAAVLRSRARPDDRVLVPSLRDEWALAWYLAGPEWARGVWTGGPLEALRHAFDGGLRPALVSRLVTWGAQAGPEVPGVLAVAELDRAALARANRIWVLTRSPAQRERLRARTELGPELAAFDLSGLELTLHGAPDSRERDPLPETSGDAPRESPRYRKS